MTSFDPYGRPTRQPSRGAVPIEVARKLQERAEAALRALRERDVELDRALEEVQALRQRLAQVPPDRATELEQSHAEIVALRRRLAAAEAQRPAEPVAEPDDRVARLSADLANVRRHRDEEIERARREGQAEGLVALADAADDLRRALEAAPADGPWFEGLSRLLERVRGRLAGAGAVEIGAVGEPFDPARHEAIGLGAGEPDTVVHVGRTGLVAPDGTLLRPASVVVGQGGG
jgi:molecular chaperone GrpE